MSSSKLSALALLSCAFVPALLPLLIAERHCPGNVPSVPLRLVERTLILVSVEVNHQGPFDFLVDTGAQVTVLDRNLAKDLHLNTEGSTGVVGVGSRSDASWTRLATLETGSYSASNVLVVIQNLAHLRGWNRNVAGILGGNFLSQFDLFIDYDHNLLCLDSTGAMGQTLKGSRTAFVTVQHAAEEIVLSTPPVIRASFGGRSRRELLLLLDSGTNEPLLYNAESLQGSTTNAGTVGRGIDGMVHEFAGLPANDLTIEGDRAREISFITTMAAAGDVPQVAFDGLLPTSLFKRIYISYSGHYAMIDPR